MAVSGSYDFTITGDEIIEEALRNIGQLGQEGSASASQLTNHRRVLNVICRELTPENTGLFTVETYQKAIVATDASFAFPTKYIDVVKAYVNYSNIDTPVNILTKAQYHDIPTKTTTGIPENIMIDMTGTPTVYLYPVSNVSCTLNIVAHRLIDDFDASSNNPNAPAKWFRFLIAEMSYYLSGQYGLPSTEKDRLRDEATGLKIRAMGTDYERTGATVISPSVPVV